MVMATPVYRECKIGRGTVTEYRGCVVDPFEDDFGFSPLGQKLCSCDLSDCKLKEGGAKTGRMSCASPNLSQVTHDED